MGMYTELIFGASLKEDTPIEVIETLKNMIGMDCDESKVIEIDFSRSPLVGSSYYFGVCESLTKLWYDEISGEWILSTRSNIKNYYDDIEKFLEWIKPYIESGSGSNDMYAIVTYECSGKPTVYYLNGDNNE